jgi:membrane protein
MILTAFMCVCLIIIVVMLPVGTLATKFVMTYSEKLPYWVQEFASGPSLLLLTIARYIIGLTVMQILIGVLYHFGRSQRQRLRFFTPGSVFAGIGWILTGFIMRIYVEHYSNYSATYGAVAGMVIMLMIFYLNAVIILAGAELDSEIQHIRAELGSHFREEPGASMPHG